MGMGIVEIQNYLTEAPLYETSYPKVVRRLESSELKQRRRGWLRRREPCRFFLVKEEMVPDYGEVPGVFLIRWWLARGTED